MCRADPEWRINIFNGCADQVVYKGLALFLKNEFDLVITDFSMSGMDGIYLTYYIKEGSPSTQVVLMTGDEKEFILSRIRDTAVDQALFKPFTSAEMDATVQGVASLKIKELARVSQGAVLTSEIHATCAVIVISFQ